MALPSHSPSLPAPPADQQKTEGRPLLPLSRSGNLVRPRRGLVVVVLLAVPLLLPPDMRFDYSLWAANVIMTLSVVAVTGASGQVSLGQAGLMAAGAYGAAVSSLEFGLPQPVPLIAGVAVAALLGLLLGLACLRLYGLYLAVVTLAFGWAVPELILKAEPLTGGYQGLFTEQIQVGGINLNDGLSGAYFSTIPVVLAFLLVSNMLSNWSRLNVLAVKESEVLASAFGIRVSRQRLWAFLMSSALAGLAGYLYAFNVGAIAPSSFTFENSVAFLAAAVIGGIASPRGAIFGATFVTVIPHVLAQRPEAASLIYGALLFLAIVLRGAVGRLRRRSTPKAGAK